MQFFKLLTYLAIPVGFTFSAPMDTELHIRDSIESSHIEAPTDDAPRCGYVRLHEDDGYNVGLYLHSACEPIYNEQEASTSRIDEAGCTCEFYASMISCENGDNVPSHTGPEPNENRFEGTKPKFVFCQPSKNK